jgi:micrococcal nuclease
MSNPVGIVLLCAGLLLCAVVFHSPSTVLAVHPVAQVIGVASVKDGDGLLFGKVEVRLQGVAAPELRDPYGEESKAALAALVEGKTGFCELDGTVASSNRPVGVCFIDGVEVGAEMIRLGFARDCPAFSLGRYEALELKARAEGRNLSLLYDLPEYC